MAMNFDWRGREGAVYCNGAVHWIRNTSEVDMGMVRFLDGGTWKEEFRRDEIDVLHYFHINHERLQVVSAIPPVPLVVRNIPLVVETGFSFKKPTEQSGLAQICFGECGGRLYLIETYKHCMTQFDVFQMERDYSGWSVKYHVDLNPLVAVLPGQDWKAFMALCLSQEEETCYGTEDTSTNLLIHLPGKVISYNLENKTFKTCVELVNKELFLALGDNHHFPEDDVTFPYMETLACV